MAGTQLLSKSENIARTSTSESSVSILGMWNILRVLAYLNDLQIASSAVEYSKGCSIRPGDGCVFTQLHACTQQRLFITFYLLIPFHDFEDLVGTSCL